MALWDFLKRKKEVQKSKEKKPDKVFIAPETVKQEKKEVASKKSSSSKKSHGFSYSIVKEPHISEKSTLLAEGNKYVFKVYDHVNKPEIKKSVEGMYGVNVLSVNMVKIPKKKRRIGRTEGFKKGYAKAIVTIQEGQKIELF